jgi:hypothetical protein
VAKKSSIRPVRTPSLADHEVGNGEVRWARDPEGLLSSGEREKQIHVGSDLDFSYAGRVNRAYWGLSGPTEGDL